MANLSTFDIRTAVTDFYVTAHETFIAEGLLPADNATTFVETNRKAA
ncbi:MAG: hypothetical protein AAF764_05430 [Pseudomonadota bacterium]